MRDWDQGKQRKMFFYICAPNLSTWDISFEEKKKSRIK